ncbi:chaperone Ric-8A-like [Branchiostoma floridae x Branchiostoma belcheri]
MEGVDEVVAALQGGDQAEIYKHLQSFNTQNAQTFGFPDLQQDKRKDLVLAILEVLNKDMQPSCHATCLSTIRILSRDKASLQFLAKPPCVTTLLKHAGMDGAEAVVELPEDEVMAEAEKCLCNIIFTSPTAQRLCSSNGCVEGVAGRLKCISDPHLSYDVKIFAVRLTFLLTALCIDIRQRLQVEFNAPALLLSAMEHTLGVENNSTLGTLEGVVLTDEQVDLLSEILKTMFNVTLTGQARQLDEEELERYKQMTAVCRYMLMCRASSETKQEELHSHTINLMTNMPRSCLGEVIVRQGERGVGTEYDGWNMDAIMTILDFLERRVDQNKRLLETLTPVLTCLIAISRANRNIRKFLRTKVLPPLRDVESLPQEGCKLRNKCVRLMTCVVTEVKETAAEFLFVLCKENVDRLVKYTGFGNAAGLLAHRGLLAGGPSSGQDNYSSGDEESDTEEYLVAKDKINPVTGRVEPDRPNPLEEMTEEQKEHLFMQLASDFDKLTREGIVKPTMIGSDGRLHVVEGGVAEMVARAQTPPPDHSDNEEEDPNE